jgi:CDP-4-dehydro-6-deoxyglucose reductase, E3
MPPPPVHTMDAVVARIDDLTHDVRTLTLRMRQPDRLDFRAGQFISFTVAQPGQRFSATRAYSIASSPDAGSELLLLLNLVPGGPGSQYLFGLQPGDVASFKGPYGTFVLPENDRELLFIATSTGIAPLWSMLAWLARHDPQRRVTLIWGLRAERDLYFQQELAGLTAAMPHFRSIVTLSQPGPDWPGPQGRVQAVLESQFKTVDGLEIYLCGNGAMIKDIAQLMKSRGDCTIHREQYFAPPRPTISTSPP